MATAVAPVLSRLTKVATPPNGESRQEPYRIFLVAFRALTLVRVLARGNLFKLVPAGLTAIFV